MTFRHYIKKKWHRVQFLLTVCYVLSLMTLLFIPGRIHWARCLRPGVLIARNRSIRRIFEAVTSMLPKIAAMIGVVMMFILVYSVIGVHMFAEAYNAVDVVPLYKGAFDNVAIAMLRLFVLVTTENYPEFMQPAYSSDPSAVFFFASFLYFGIFVLLAMLLATIVGFYWDYAKTQVIKESKKERKALVKAFNVLDPDGIGYIDKSTWSQLFRMLKPKGERYVPSSW